ncbi:hypothetical protein MTO96_027370 [Rhipicephalus appendiculatus]
MDSTDFSRWTLGQAVTVVSKGFPGVPKKLRKPDQVLTGPGNIRLDVLGVFQATLEWKEKATVKVPRRPLQILLPPELVDPTLQDESSDGTQSTSEDMEQEPSGTTLREVSFFAFPKDPLLKKRWLVAIKRDEGKLFAVTKHTKVCSTHFANDDYLPNVVGGRRYLRVDALPSVFAFGKPQRPARRKPRDGQQCVSRAQRLSAIGQAGSSELALETTLSPGGDVAVSRDCATADEALDATECSDSASAPTSATDFQECQEVCGCTCAATVVNLEEQLSEHQARIRQLESDLEVRTEEVKCASASAARVPELEMQLSLLQVHVQQLKIDLEARTKEVKSAKVRFIKLKESAK